MGKKANTKKKEVVEQKQEVVQEETAEKAAPKYVNPILSWGLILAELLIAAGIGAAIIIPLL